MSRVTFHVAPRYTAGSPALVTERTARLVAEEERRWYERLLEHPGMIPAETARAEREGLQGIAYETYEANRKIYVRDLITEEEFEVPLKNWGGHWYSRTDRNTFLRRI